MTTPIAPGTSIGHVHLKVADLERALGFYCGVLGFELQARYGTQAAFISAGGYHHHIGLNTWESLGGTPPPPGHTGLYHTAILYPTRRDLADALRRLTAAGIQLDGASDHGVSEALYLRDPDEQRRRALPRPPRVGMAPRRRGQPQDEDRTPRPEVAPRRAGRGRLGATASRLPPARRFARRPAPRTAGNVPSSEAKTERHRHRPRGARRNVAQHRFTLFSPYLEIYFEIYFTRHLPARTGYPRTLRDLSAP